jgi:hypothetical protein
MRAELGLKLRDEEPLRRKAARLIAAARRHAVIARERLRAASVAFSPLRSIWREAGMKSRPRGFCEISGGVSAASERHSGVATIDPGHLGASRLRALRPGDTETPAPSNGRARPVALGALASRPPGGGRGRTDGSGPDPAGAASSDGAVADHPSAPSSRLDCHARPDY